MIVNIAMKCIIVSISFLDRKVFNLAASLPQELTTKQYIAYITHFQLATLFIQFSYNGQSHYRRRFWAYDIPTFPQY